MPTKKPVRIWSPPETKYFPIGDGVGQFELVDDRGFPTKAIADALANDWRRYPKGSHARVLKIKGRYYVYVM